MLTTLLLLGKTLFLKLALILNHLFPMGMGTKLFLAGSPALVPFSTSSRMVVQRVRASLTSAQILALFSGTAVPVVPAPGVGFRIVPLMIVLALTGGSAAYVDGGGGAVSFNVGSSSLALGSNAIFLVTVSPNKRTATLLWQATAGTPMLDTAANPPSDDNAAMTISKATADFTAGTGTMGVTVYYVVEPTT